MSDADAPSDARPDHGPWAIKSIPSHARDAAVAAAKRQRVTVGEWLTEAIRLAVEREREPVGGPEPEIMRSDEPGRALAALADRPRVIGLESLTAAVTIAERLATLRPNGRPPRAIVREIERRLLEGLTVSE